MSNLLQILRATLWGLTLPEVAAINSQVRRGHILTVVVPLARVHATVTITGASDENIEEFRVTIRKEKEHRLFWKGDSRAAAEEEFQCVG